MSPTPRDDFTRTYLFEGLTVFSAPALDNAMHRHCPATLIGSLDGEPIETRLGQGERLRAPAMLVAPGAEQATSTGGRHFVDLLIDPDHPLWARCRAFLAGAPAREIPASVWSGVADSLRALRHDDLDCAAAARCCERVVASLGADPAPLDPRIAEAARTLRRAPPGERGDTAELARAAGLSRSRFLHLWKREIGVAPRAFALWTRVARAPALWREGAPLTELALECGFYDLAHFTRSVRSMLAFAPSSLLDGGQVLLHRC